MKLAVPRETAPDESRVALTPNAIGALTKAGLEVVIETGAGVAAGFTDKAYTDAGATIARDRDAAFDADIVVQVRTHGANPTGGDDDMLRLREGQVVIGHAEPLLAHEANKAMAGSGVTLLAMELVPRITRAQVMDALSSQANIAGYKAVLMAANIMPKMFPMMMTAAGTIKPARVFVVGAGVAGLQAIATAKRLGAVVSAIDVRPAVKEQVESLGAKFIAPPSLAEGEGGYAKEMTDEQKAEQQQMMADTIAESDVVITTAAIPGRKSPVLIAADVVDRMKPRSVIVDLAAERGGNCELTETDKTIETENGVTIIGLANIAGTVPADASAMYAKNVATLAMELVEDGALKIDRDDEVVAGTLVCIGGEIVNPRVREAMGLEPLATPEPEGPADSDDGSAAKPQAAETKDTESAPSGGGGDA